MLSGWAIGKKGETVVRVQAFADGREVSEVRTGIPRPDVRAAYPEIAGVSPGFALSATLARPPEAMTVIRLVLSTARGATEEFEVMYGF